MSTAGGSYARWRSDGKELYYLGPEGQMMAVPIAATGTLVLSARTNVRHEINRAFSKNKTLFVFRTEDVALGKSLEPYLARQQWIDAFPG